MSAKVLSAAVVGLDAQIVEVEADITRGLPKFYIVGLPDTAVSEAKERVRSGIKNSGLEYPYGVVTVNLAPANLKKEGPSYDVPIALAIAMARHEVETPADIGGKIFIGELSLSGDIRPVAGVLSVAMAAKQAGITELFAPSANAAEAALVDGLTVFPVNSLSEIIGFFNGAGIILPYAGVREYARELTEYQFDMNMIRGQEQAKRALEIAAAGGHNVLMTGPPGSGKTLLSKTMPSILPDMTFDESLEVTKIYSVAGLLPKEVPLVRERPFRSPHHTTSSVALVGGGSFPKPGEISLAHRGVLFLDEFSEFSRGVLESLRQPLEDGIITVARAAGSVRFPARFALIAARNPCPCGYFNDPRQSCTCSAQQIIKYQKKISGPLLDRIDIHITVPRLSYEKVAVSAMAEKSCNIRRRVQSARLIQQKRFIGSNLVVNAEMTVRQIDKFCGTEAAGANLLKSAVNQFYLSTRAYHRLLKVARTIADLAGVAQIKAEHIAEALQYRPQAG